MNPDHARLIRDCYYEGIDTGFFIGDKYCCLRKGSGWVLRIGNMKDSNVLAFDVVAVYLEPAINGEPYDKRGFLIIDLDGDAVIKVFYTEGEE